MSKKRERKYFDRYGYLIQEDDLLRGLHFIDSDGKKRYLYHSVARHAGKLYAVHYTDHSFPKKHPPGGTCTLAAYFRRSKHRTKEVEILVGGGLMHYTRRETGKPS
jgi:hypothetical protein